MKKSKWIMRIIVILMIQFIVGIYSYDVCESVNNNFVTWYRLKDDRNSEYIKPKQEGEYNIYLDVKNPGNFIVYALVDGKYKEDDSFSLVVSDTNGNSLYYKEYTAAEVVEHGGFVVEGVYTMHLGQEFRVNIRAVGKAGISVSSTEDGYLLLTEYFEFAPYGKLLKVGIIVANIGLFLLNIFLCSKVKIEYKFAVLAVLISFVGVILVPPCSAPDEWRHFLRAYDIAQGNFISTNHVEIYDGVKIGGCEIPVEYQAIKNTGIDNDASWSSETVFKISMPHYLQLFTQRELSGEMVTLPMVGTEVSGVFNYLPQVIFILIALFLGMPPIGVFYMARIGGLVACALIAMFAIRLAPKYKIVMTTLFFVPTMIFMRGAISTDGMIFSLVMLMMAYTLYLREKKISIYSKKVLAVYVFLGGYISLLKIPYILFVIVLMLTVREQEEQIDIKKYAKLILYMVIVAVLAMVLVRCISNLFLLFADVPVAAATDAPAPNGGESLTSYAMNHTGVFLSVLVRTYLDTFMTYMVDAVASDSGTVTPFAYILLILWVCHYDDFVEWNVFQRWYILLGSLIMWAAIVFAFYTVTGVGATEIWGLQGRYMTPIFLLAALCMPKGKAVNKELLKEYTPMLIVACNAIYWLSKIEKYWC